MIEGSFNRIVGTPKINTAKTKNTCILESFLVIIASAMVATTHDPTIKVVAKIRFDVILYDTKKMITGRNSMIFTSIANYPSLFFLSN